MPRQSNGTPSPWPSITKTTTRNKSHGHSKHIVKRAGMDRDDGQKERGSKAEAEAEARVCEQLETGGQSFGVEAFSARNICMYCWSPSFLSHSLTSSLSFIVSRQQLDQTGSIKQQSVASDTTTLSGHSLLPTLIFTRTPQTSRWSL